MYIYYQYYYLLTDRRMEYDPNMDTNAYVVGILYPGQVIEEKDMVEIPAGAGLEEVHVKKLSAAQTSPESADVSQPESTHTLPRQSFTITETVPLLFVLFKSNVILNGTITWESNALVWKVRTFEEVEIDDGTGTDTTNAKATKVSERIEGKCLKWMRRIMQKEAKKGHTAHVNSYHTLFE
ncbi:hypothetical protein BT96DRAFT_973989 [Gymnopus androsaceus JB14]|uniref:Uncharacterized protein n=1 Tax=Gymnopus androsaceus JB14 TaxID=1447944 RepID=A0A6A4HUK3_9AGAR|nr:hypothetical protein BT96DRAFT_973989 [Gymnopus androsaceus JB14]